VVTTSIKLWIESSTGTVLHNHPLSSAHAWAGRYSGGASVDPHTGTFGWLSAIGHRYGRDKSESGGPASCDRASPRPTPDRLASAP
jgi:hypothetical protein